MPDVANNALGLAQYICSGRSEEFAVNYLQCIERLTHADWREAKGLLDNADQTNRRTKEATIADIVFTLKNEPITTNYLVRDLSLCPGLSKEALQLVEFSTATLFSVQQDIVRMSSRSRDIIEQEKHKLNQQSTQDVCAAQSNAHDINISDFPHLIPPDNNSSLPPSAGR